MPFFDWLSVHGPMNKNQAGSSVAWLSESISGSVTLCVEDSAGLPMPHEHSRASQQWQTSSDCTVITVEWWSVPDGDTDTAANADGKGVESKESADGLLYFVFSRVFLLQSLQSLKQLCSGNMGFELVIFCKKNVISWRWRFRCGDGLVATP